MNPQLIVGGASLIVALSVGLVKEKVKNKKLKKSMREMQSWNEIARNLITELVTGIDEEAIEISEELATEIEFYNITSE